MATAGMSLAQRARWFSINALDARNGATGDPDVPSRFMCAGAPDSREGHALTTNERGEEEVVVDYYKRGHLGSGGLDE
jgi:hypothetical protein